VNEVEVGRISKFRQAGANAAVAPRHAAFPSGRRGVHSASLRDIKVHAGAWRDEVAGGEYAIHCARLNYLILFDSRNTMLEHWAMVEKYSRNQSIYLARSEGRTFCEIARDHHISAERARKIFSRECLQRQFSGRLGR
jgi:hypothetical protein